MIASISGFAPPIHRPGPVEPLRPRPRFELFIINGQEVRPKEEVKSRTVLDASLDALIRDINRFCALRISSRYDPPGRFLYNG